MSLIVAVVALVLGGAVTPAEAADPAKARAHFQEGRKLYQVGEYRAALEEFKRAFLMNEDGVFLFNIAQCHRQLGDARAAVTFYRRYLAAVPGAPNRATVEKMIAELEGPPPAPAPSPSPPPVRVAEPPPARPPGLVVTSPPPPAPEEAGGGHAWWWVGAGVLVAGAVVAAVLLTRPGKPTGCSAGVDDCWSLAR